MVTRAIKLQNIILHSNSVDFEFSVSDTIEAFFFAHTLHIEYSEAISSVPISILTVAFVSNFLPQAWTLDATIEVDELDEDFYNCIPKIVAGYREMYTKWKISGTVVAKKLIKNAWKTERTGTLFSGGMDAVQTMFEHYEEKPELITFWGADVAYENERGWRVVHDKIAETADLVKMKSIIIRSNFRKIENEGGLEQLVRPQLCCGWWVGIKHAVALFGMVAPLAFIRRYSSCYVASSFSRSKGMIPCASNPWTDSEFRTGSFRMIHDGYAYERQDKARRIIEDCNKYHIINVPLHVCWKTKSGKNCCMCEKCLRTITELLIEDGNPEEMGFAGFRKYYTFKNVVKTIRRTLYAENSRGEVGKSHIWNSSRQRIAMRKRELRKSEFWPIFNWMLKHDFTSAKDITLPFEDRMALFAKRFLRIG